MPAPGAGYILLLLPLLNKATEERKLREKEDAERSRQRDEEEFRRWKEKRILFANPGDGDKLSSAPRPRTTSAREGSFTF